MSEDIDVDLPEEDWQRLREEFEESGPIPMNLGNKENPIWCVLVYLKTEDGDDYWEIQS